MIRNQIIDHHIEQGLASYVDYLNYLRLIDLNHTLELIINNETDRFSELASKTQSALSNLNWAKMEIDNLISINRGGDTGVHGFISEFAETGIRNARDVYQGLQKSVVLLNDNGPADILLQGKEVQMKFYANILKEINQASNYDKMSMLFPKDHVEVIEQIMRGEKVVKFNEGFLSNSQINNIRKAIEEESDLRGVSYKEWLESSVLKYKEVQKGSIDHILSEEINDINTKTTKQKSDIKKETNRDRLIAQQEAQPTFGEATKVAGIGAAVKSGINLGIFVFQKHKNGKEVWNYDFEDWKECGILTAESALKGGISGYSIYGLTNVSRLSAPSAGAITSGTFGLINAIVKYRKCDIDTDGFIDLVILNSIDATGAAIGAAIGQTIIPIPVVGALVGSILTTTAISLGKGVLNRHEIEVISLYQEKMLKFVNELNKEHQKKYNELLKEYHKLGELQNYSFDININVLLKFANSIELAQSVGVPEERILKNEDEIDQYFIS